MEVPDTSVSEMTAFTAVAQVGSFTHAAEILGVTKSSVTKAIQRIEARLGAKLFHRTTRAVRLTEDGEIYRIAVQTALDSLKDAEIAIATSQSEPAGRVRLDLPAGLGRHLLDPLARLRIDCPKITLELSFTDKMSDPVADGWDIIVRIGELAADSGMTVRKLCHLHFGMYAAPKYPARRGKVNSISDLRERDAIIFRAPSGRMRPWSLQQQNGQIEEMSPHPALVVSDGQALVDATIAGYGVAQLLDGIAHPYVRDGQLEHILPKADVGGLPVHAILPLGNKLTAKTRFVLDHLSESIRGLLN